MTQFTIRPIKAEYDQICSSKAENGRICPIIAEYGLV